MNVESLRNFLRAVAEIADEAMLQAEGGRLRFRGMDPAHIIYAELTMGADGCEVEGSINVNIVDLEKCLKHVDGDVGLKLEDKRLKVFNNNFTAALNTLSTTYSEVPVPKLKHECEVDLGFTGLRQAIDHAELFSDQLRFTATEAALTAKAKNDYGELERNIPVASLKTEKDTVSASFSVPYLQKINKILKHAEAEDIKLYFATNKPLEIRGEGLFTAAIFLAPRIE